MKYYIAHPFNSREEVKEWAAGLVIRHPTVKIINALDDNESNEDFQPDDKNTAEYYAKLGEDQHIGIVERDIELLLGCNACIAIINGQTSFGTIMEIVYAYINDLPIYLISTNDQKNHPWLKYHATNSFDTHEEFETFLGELEDDVE